MSEVIIREATMGDVAVILANSAFAVDATATTALTGYMVMSDRTYIGLIDGQIVCTWGVMRQSLLSNQGYLWLLTMKEAEEHKFLLIRYSQRIVQKLLKRYDVLAGECVLEDARAQKWMKLLGATFSFPEGKTIPFQIVGKNG